MHSRIYHYIIVLPLRSFAVNRVQDHVILSHFSIDSIHPRYSISTPEDLFHPFGAIIIYK
jgi:hypothetical protein